MLSEITHYVGFCQLSILSNELKVKPTSLESYTSELSEPASLMTI